MGNDREKHLAGLRARDYRGPKVRSYPEPTQAEQARNLQEVQSKGRNRRRIKHV